MPLKPTYDEIFQWLSDTIGDPGIPVTPTTTFTDLGWSDAYLRNFLHTAVWHRWGVVLNPDDVGSTLDSLTQSIQTAVSHIVGAAASMRSNSHAFHMMVHGISQILGGPLAPAPAAPQARALRKPGKPSKAKKGSEPQ